MGFPFGIYTCTIFIRPAETLQAQFPTREARSLAETVQDQLNSEVDIINTIIILFILMSSSILPGYKSGTKVPCSKMQGSHRQVQSYLLVRMMECKQTMPRQIQPSVLRNVQLPHGHYQHQNSHRILPGQPCSLLLRSTLQSQIRPGRHVQQTAHTNARIAPTTLPQRQS